MITIRDGYAIIHPMTSDKLPHSIWRLIICEPLPGPQNMALDAAILAAVGREESPATLRLYQPDIPCLSLGINQPYSDVDEEQLIKNSWHILRRPTGGMAVLHADELVYAVIGPKSDPRLEGSLKDSYHQISRAILNALKSLGLPVEIHSGKNPEAHYQPVCFENPSDFEITIEGKKIIGNAQIRKLNCLLQHGSLPLTGDLTRITEVLSYPSPTARQQAGEALLQKATTVSEVLGKEVSWERTAQAFKESFSQTLNLTLEEGVFTPSELAEAQQLKSNQYEHPDWTKGTLHKKDLF